MRFAFFSAVVCATAALAQTPPPSVLTLQGDVPSGSAYFGATVATLGDLTGDGRAEIAVGAPREFDGALRNVGAVYVLEAATGARLATLRPAVSEEYAEFGMAVATVGDLDGDGVPELAVGVRDGTGSEGEVRVFDGATVAAGGTLTAPLATVRAPTRAASARFGYAITGLGDLDGDGVPDLAIGAYADLSASGARTGRAYVVSGAGVAAGGTVTTALAVLDGSNSQANFGLSLVGLGDLDGDGLDELAVGAPQGASFEGSVTVYSGAALAAAGGGAASPLVTLLDPDGERLAGFGQRVANVGDLNGDGRDDLAVGVPLSDRTVGGTAYDSAGRVVVFSGQSIIGGGTLRLAQLVSPTPQNQDYFGTAFAAIGDLDGRGIADLAVGSVAGGGAVYVMPGESITRFDLRTYASPLASVEGNGGLFGAAVAGPGDLGRAGVPSVLVGAPSESSGRVRVYTFPPTTVAPEPLIAYASPSPDPFSAFGTALAVLGDVDGDGTADLAVSQPETSQDGRAFLVSGATGAEIATLVPDNPSGADNFGSVIVARLDDVDGDGVPDVAIPAHREDVGGVLDAGRVYVFSGATGARLYTIQAPTLQQYGYFGRITAGVPDLDGDGRGDLYIQRAVGEFSPTDGGVYSGATGARIHALNDPATGQAYPVVYGIPSAVQGGSTGLFAVQGTDGIISVLSPGGTPILSFDAATLGVGSATLGGSFGDADGDGFPELMVRTNSPRTVLLVAAKNALVVSRIDFAGPGTFGFGTTAPVPDVDGDGLPDLAAVVSGEQVHVYGGLSGERLRQVSVPTSTGVLAGLDADADGVGDVAIAFLRDDAEAVTGRVVRAGRVRVYAGADQAGQGASTHTVELRGGEGWRLIAPSLGGQTYDDLLGPLWTQGYPGADAAPTNPSVANVYTYTEAVAGTIDEGYVPLSDQANAAPLGVGVFAFVYEDDDVGSPGIDGGFPKSLVLTGTALDGPFEWSGDAAADAPLSFTDTGAPAADGWNLLGNPFDVAMDWDAGWTRTGVSASVYVWDPLHVDGPQYRTWNGLAGGLGSGLVPAGNGFWVQAPSSSPSLVAPVAARSGVEAPVYGRTASVPVIALRAVADTPGGERANTAYVIFADGASPGFDSWDAWELTPHSDPYLSLWAEGEGETGPLAFDIDARPLGDADVPLGVRVVAGGEDETGMVTLSWDADVPDGWTVRLRDRRTGAQADLTTGATLEVESPIASGAVVLEIRTGPAVATEPGPSTLVLKAPRPNPTTGDATISYTLPTSGPAQVMVFDVLGRHVATLADGVHAAGPHTARLGHGLGVGVYLVRLQSGDEVRTARLTVVSR